MTEKITVDESIVKDEIRTFDWEDKTIEVKRFLPFDDAIAYVNSVVSGCLDEDNNYMPEALDFVRRYEFINFYTNISLPKNTSGMYKILYGTELYNDVCELVDLDQVDVLWSAINDRINMFKYDRRSVVEKQMADLYAMMKNLSDILGDTVGDVTGEQITEFMKTLAGGQINENKIVSALLDEKRKEKNA